MTLREIFQQSKRRTLSNGWLYLPVDVEWTLDTEGIFLESRDEDEDSDEIPLVARQRDLGETLDDGTIEDVVDWADRLAGREEDEARLEVFRYYFRFDAFPERLGAPDPPTADEIMRQLDRKFYESLAPESAGTKCRHDECDRGRTKFSVFCRVHHFEQIKERPCPFRD